MYPSGVINAGNRLRYGKIVLLSYREKRTRRYSKPRTNREQHTMIIHNTIASFIKSSGFSEQMVRGHLIKHSGKHSLSDDAYARMVEDRERLNNLSDREYNKMAKESVRIGKSIWETLRLGGWVVTP